MRSRVFPVGFFKSVYFKIIALLITLCLFFLLAIGSIYDYSQRYFKEEFQNNSELLGSQVSLNVENTLRTLEQRNFAPLTLIDNLGSSLDKVNRSGGVGLETGYWYAQLNNSLDSCMTGSRHVNWMALVDLNSHVCITRKSNRTPLEADQILSLVREHEDHVKRNYGAVEWLKGEDAIYFIRAVFNRDTLKYSGCFFAEVEKGAFAPIFAGLDFGKVGHFVIFDNEGNTLYSTEQTVEPLSFLSDLEKTEKEEGRHEKRSGYSSVIYEIGNQGLQMVHYINLQEKNRQLYGILQLCIWLGIGLIACAGVITVMMLGHTAGEINHLFDYLDELSKGEFEAEHPVWSEDEIGVIGGHIQKMGSRIKGLLNQAAEAEKQKQQSEYQLLQARYSTLQAQVNPHFLYNCLQSINSIAQLQGDERVSELICRLAAFFRSNINRSAHFCQLKEELDYIDNYLNLYQGIYGDQLKVEYEIDSSLSHAVIPTFIMQPIVENSLVHGMENKIDTCTVKISVSVRGDFLMIEVTDDGGGIPPEKLATLLQPSTQPGSKRVGLKNVHERIKLLYGEHYGLQIESRNGTSVRIIMPLRFEEEE